MFFNNNSPNFTGKLSSLSKPLEVFYDKNSSIPTLLIETGVVLGRTYEAYKTGGKKEAIERFVEQSISALVWLFGVKAIKGMIDCVGKLLNIDNSKNFKAGNIIASTALATGFIGFVLPKINHYISSKLIKESEQKNSPIKPLSFEEFQNKTSKTKKEPSFGSLQGFANLLENNSAARLFITDTGVILGRFKNGRNKYERIEGLFRDITSIFFYLKSTDLIVKALKKLTKTANIAPSMLKKIVEDVKNNKLIIDENAKEFVKNAVGDVLSCANKTIKKNLAFYSIGTLFSTFALGILIPKAQYFLRKQLTNTTQFPGDDNYKVDEK